MTFDLEKARKIVDAMSPTPWIVLEDRYGQIDVIRNPNHPLHEEGVIELWGRTNETATPDAIGISYMRSEFPNALDEIERLLKALDESENNYKDDIFNHLINFLCQERAKLLQIEHNKPLINGLPNADHTENIGDFMDSAREQLLTEGKIGNIDRSTDATKMVWHITQKRKNLLRFLLSGDFDRNCTCTYCQNALEEGRAMLEEAAHDP